MSNIREVAKRAGVAPITVSRVVNNSGYVKPETRARVEAVIAELQYVPNSLARSLRFNQTHTIALVLTDVTNPFWTTVARGVEDAASEQGFTMFLCNTDESEAKQTRYLNVLLEKRVDGILLVPVGSNPDPIDLIQQQGVAVVVLDRRVSHPAVDVVRGDSELGAYQLTRLMLEQGHQRIALLTGPRDVSTSEDRVSGYRRALTGAGLPVAPELIHYGTFSQAAGYELMRQALNTMPWPTGVLAANNFIAMGAMRALRDIGLRIPEDITLVAFDDLPATLIIDPFLTVVAQPAYHMGQRATQLLLARLSGQTASPPQEIVLPTELVVRRSSGPPRK
jgi:LacI family transcriptional regulator